MIVTSGTQSYDSLDANHLTNNSNKTQFILNWNVHLDLGVTLFISILHELMKQHCFLLNRDSIVPLNYQSH